MGGLRWGLEQKKTNTSLFLERPKKESRNITVAQYLWFSCGTCWTSVCAPKFVCVGVCFLSSALGGRLTVEVIPSQGSFEWDGITFHRPNGTNIFATHSLAPSSSARISPISLQAYADRLNELHKVLKSVCQLGSKVSIPLCTSKRAL